MISALYVKEGDRGVDEKLRIIRKLIDQGRESSIIRGKATEILRSAGVPSHRPGQEVNAIFDWVQKNIRYTRDPVDVEYIQTPQHLLKTRTGDCDCMTALIGSLVESIGYPVDLKVIQKAGRPGFHHIYPVAQVGRQAVALDASVPFPLGYETPGIIRKKINRGRPMLSGIYKNINLGDIQTRIGRTRRLVSPGSPFGDTFLEEAERNYRFAANRYLEIYYDIQNGNFAKYGTPGGARIKLARAERNMNVWAKKLENAEEIMAGMKAQWERMQENKPKPPEPPPPKPGTDCVLLPAGTFAPGEIAPLKKLDYYNLRGRVWPGKLEVRSIPSGETQTLKVDFIQPYPTDPTRECVAFRWTRIAISEKPPEPPSIYQPPPDQEIDLCTKRVLSPGQLLYPKGKFKVGDIPSLLDSMRIIKKHDQTYNQVIPGYRDIREGEVRQLIVRNVQSCGPDSANAIYTFNYRYTEAEPVAPPVPYQPPPSGNDITEPPPAFKPDVPSVPGEESGPGEGPGPGGGTGLPVLMAGVPWWAWLIGAGVFLPMLFGKKGR